MYAASNLESNRHSRLALHTYFNQLEFMKTSIQKDKSVKRRGRHPMQPIVAVKGVARFKENKIVSMLLDTHPTIDLNILARMDFSRADRNQFAQLIGYSVSGFGDLGYCYPSDVAEADEYVNEHMVKRTSAK